MNDNQLAQLYERFNVPSDQIAQNQATRKHFVDFVNQETHEQNTDESVIERLITLRKQGKLPRLRR